METELGYDAGFELNEFNQPKLKSEVELIRDVLLFVLFSTPGQYPSLPNIGLNIKPTLYTFYDELDVEELKGQIMEQCEALGYYFKNGTIFINKTIYNNQPSLLISINGTASYPDNYLADKGKNNYLVGITFDEAKEMIYNVAAT